MTGAAGLFMARKAGTFLLLAGIALLALYVFSDLAGSADFAYLFAGIGLLVLGIILRKANPVAPPPPSSRFGVLKRGAGGKKEKPAQKSKDRKP